MLEAGRIVEEGPHDRLIAAGGRYAALWAAWSSPTSEQTAETEAGETGAGETGAGSAGDSRPPAQDLPDQAGNSIRASRTEPLSATWRSRTPERWMPVRRVV